MEKQLTLEDVIELTEKIGEEWAVAHAKRLLELIRLIGEDLTYDTDLLELAAYMHDWGAFSLYIQKGVEHALRSRQVVEADFLPRLDLPPAKKEILLETIELHDYRDMRLTVSNEALLLREADMLEFLGMIGMARDFARGPRNVETCYNRILSRIDVITGRFTLPRAQQIAEERLQKMETALSWLVEESFGTM
jgi:HD superfamily phosphodiesterase